MKNTQRSITSIHEIATYDMDISANEARRNTHRLRVEVLLRVTLLHSQRFETRAFSVSPLSTGWLCCPSYSALTSPLQRSWNTLLCSMS